MGQSLNVLGGNPAFHADDTLSGHRMERQGEEEKEIV